MFVYDELKNNSFMVRNNRFYFKDCWATQVGTKLFSLNYNTTILTQYNGLLTNDQIAHKLKSRPPTVREWYTGTNFNDTLIVVSGGYDSRTN